MPNQHRRDKANGPKPKPDLPYDAIPGIQHAVAALAGAPMQEISHTSTRSDALRARTAMIVALADCNFRGGDIADAMLCDRSGVYTKRNRWRNSEPSKMEAAVYAEVVRLIEKAMQPPKPASALFARRGAWTAPRTQPTMTASQRVQAEMRRRESQRQRLEDDGGGLRQWVD